MSEWISVKEQIPVGEPRLLYVVHSPAEDIPPYMLVGYFNRLTRMWCIEGEMDPSIPVTHWMPLPEPPK